MMYLSRLRPLRAKKRFLIIASALLIILAGSYILWSKQTWAQFTPSYTQWHQSIKANINGITTLPISTIKEQDVVAARLTDISNKIDTEHHTICTVHSLVQWQQKMITALNDAHAACKKMIASTVEFQKQLAIVIAYNKDDQALSKIITSVPQAGELAEDTWEKQVLAWGDAVKATEKISVTDNFKPTRQLAAKRMTAIKTAWQEVVTAHQAKDKPKYLAAQSTLAAAIDGLNDISITSQQTFAKLSSELETASVAAFATANNK